MYRYGDGTPFPLDENFIETMTSAVEACTSAFLPLTELDTRRDRAKAARTEADGELARLAELDKAVQTAMAPFAAADRRSAQAQAVAQKVVQLARQSIQQARTQVEGRVTALEAQAGAGTAADAVLHALRPFFDHHTLPNTKWTFAWDARGTEATAEGVATAGRLTASFSFAVGGTWRMPVRVDQLAEAVVVHMMKKGLLGKAKPAPVDLGKYVVVAFERTAAGHVITLKEKPDRASQGLRFSVTDSGATWESLGASGQTETEANPLDHEDEGGVRRLGEAANKALDELVGHRTLTDLTLGGQALAAMPEPRAVPMEVLRQLTPLSRTIRERSRVHGELVLKRDLADGRREELFVPRAKLSQHFAKLPAEYRKPFEDMGVSAEDTQPAIQLPEHMRPPASKSSPPPFPGSAAKPAADDDAD